MMGTKRISKGAGVGCVLLAAGLNGFLPLMITGIYSSGGHFTNIMFYKGLIVAPAAYLICRLQRISVKITLKQHIACAVIALLQFVTSLLLYSSYNLISTGIATTLHFMYPVAVIFLGAILFREIPCHQELISLFCCVIGVGLLGGIGSESGYSLIGIVAALFSGIVYSGYLLLIGKSEAANLPVMVFTMYVFFYNAVFSGLVSLCAGTLNGLTQRGWMITAFSAAAAGIVAMALQKGIGAIGSQTASVLSVAEPLVSVLVGVLFMGEALSVRSVLGIACVAAAAVLAATAERSGR